MTIEKLDRSLVITDGPYQIQVEDNMTITVNGDSYELIEEEWIAMRDYMTEVLERF